MARKRITIVVIAFYVMIILIGSLGTLANITVHTQRHQFSSNDIFTLTFDGQQITYSIQDLRSFNSITGTGGRMKVTGSISGPYEYTGVSITSLIDEFSPHPETFDMIAISDDGYTFKFTYDQIIGDVMVYDEQGNEQGRGGVNMILAYAEDNEPLSYGGPLRIAWVNDNDAITDAFLWPKLVGEIEFFHASSDETAPSVSILKPENAIYLFDSKLISYPFPLIIGDITIEATAADEKNDIAKMMIVIEEDVHKKRISDSIQWNFNERIIGSVTIQIIVYDSAGNVGIAEKTVTMFNPF